MVGASQKKPGLVAARPTQTGITQGSPRVAVSIWTARMLTALEQGVKGTLFTGGGFLQLEDARVAIRQSPRG